MTAAVASMGVLDALNREYSRSPQRRAYQMEEMELVEDEDFLRGGSGSPVPVPREPQESMSNNDEQLQEDENFLLPQQQGGDNSSATAAAVHHEYDDLEEDPDFLLLQEEPEASTSSARVNSDTFDVPDDDDEEQQDSLPSPTQLYANVTNGRVNVSNLDLGQKQSTTRRISGTSYSGNRVTFTRKKGNKMVGEASGSVDKDPTALGKMAMSLLETPIHILVERLEKAANDKAIAKAAGGDDEEQAAPLADVKKAKGKGKQKQMDTWTDRYKPKLFTELLGDERTHRQAMSWLKEWDSCVFKSTQSAAARKKAALKRSRDQANAASASNKENNFSSGSDADPYHRPMDKILMLTGPPGLGKTTLAHVIAHQAGYQIQEINASDDRTAKVVHDRIRQSLETRAMTSLGNLSASKPTCLIIDEIDGAGGGDAGFIRTLVKLIQDGSRVSKYKGKGKKDSPPLLRPIICICNDLYAPALRPLRTLARIVRFHPPTNAHLIKRLRTICETEGLKADNKCLNTLVEVAEGDMRSCLNTLQIVRSQSDTLHEKVIKSTALGLKDTSTSVTAVWDKLFKVPAKKRQKGVEEIIGEKYVNPLVKDITTCGEYDKLAQTCFENYLKVKSPTDGLRAISRSLDWLAFYDRLESQMRNSREYDIMPYLPYSFVAWNPLFAAVSNKTPGWPSTDYEMYTKRLAHQEIADQLTKTLPLNLKSLFTSASVISELAPLLLRIISPDLKPVNQQLIKSEDRVSLKKLVKQMLDMSVSYVPDRNEEGQIVYKIEPQLDVFVYYEGKRALDLPPARFNLRQLVAKELEAEQVRRAGGSEEIPMSKGKQAQDIIGAYKSTGKDKPKVGKESAPTAVDFFGRAIIAKIIPPTPAETEEGSTTAAVVSEEPPKKKVKVLYKFHEGFSNAVRTNVKVTELFR